MSLDLKKIQNKKVKFYNLVDFFKSKCASVAVSDDESTRPSVGNIAVHWSLPYNNKKRKQDETCIEKSTRKICLLI